MGALKPEGLMGRAYAQLRDAVVGGELRPGEPLYEIHLADKLGMSRTPVREALRVLARDGYLEELPSRGYTVPRRSLDDLREFFELREVLESTAAHYAALRATKGELEQIEDVCARSEHELDEEAWSQMGHEFHSLVVQAARNSRLQTVLHSLNAQIVISRRTVARADVSKRQAVVRDHRAIFEAIKARDELRAQALAAEHVRRSYETTLHAYQPEVFATQKPA